MDLLLALPTGATLAWLLAAALAGGLARGFSGFGAALIFVPLASIGLGTRQAAPLMLVLEVLAVALLTPAAWRIADRREVGWLALGAAVGTPLGAAVLALADPLALRWGVALAILGLLGMLVTGWRFRGVPSRPVTLGFGLAGGVLGGIAMVSGPPAMAYLLGRDGHRAAVAGGFRAVPGGRHGLRQHRLCGGGAVGPALVAPFVVGGAGLLARHLGGVRMFGLASERVFRQACFGMIALAALLSLPVWDGMLG